MPGDDLLRRRVHFLRETQIRGPTWTVVGGMRFALMLGQSQDFGIPDVAAHASRGIDGKAEVVANFGTGDALGLILVKLGIPFAGQVDLRECGQTRQGGHQQKTIEVLHCALHHIPNV